MLKSNTRIGKEFLAARGRVGLRVSCLAAAALAASASAALAQAQLNTYVDAKGYINVKALTCAQLANTFQEDAELLGVWYSGWLNGRAKSHFINVNRTKEGVHQVIVDCKANPDKKVVDVVAAFVKQVRAGGQ